MSAVLAATRWTPDQLGDLHGRTAVVTGASSGLGTVVSRHLAGAGATVVMAVRDVAKGERVRDQLASPAVRGELQVQALDLADLTSVRAFAAALVDRGRPVDVLVNNAGISNQPRTTTPQGFEAQIATNFLGHFALTGLVLGLLEAGHDARVVSVGSDLYRRTARGIAFDDLMGERSYSPGRAYTQSKLASILFGQELERRLRARGSAVRSLVAHPGMATTPMHQSLNSAAEVVLMKVMTALFARPAEQGALPILYAAAAPHAPAGLFIGPTGPKRATEVHAQEFVRAGTDTAAASRLWGVAEDLTGIRYLDR